VLQSGNSRRKARRKKKRARKRERSRNANMIQVKVKRVIIKVKKLIGIENVIIMKMIF